MTSYTCCQWIGDGSGCDHTPDPGHAYCAEHMRRVYQSGSSYGRRRKDIRTANSVHTWESLMNEAVEELLAEGFEL